jgi:hypothetical protein
VQTRRGVGAARPRDGQLDRGEADRVRRIGRRRALRGRRCGVERGIQLVEAPERLLGPDGDGLDDRQQTGGRVRRCGFHRAAILAQLAPRIVPCMSPFWIWTQVAIVVFVLAGIVIAIFKLA